MIGEPWGRKKGRLGGSKGGPEEPETARTVRERHLDSDAWTSVERPERDPKEGETGGGRGVGLRAPAADHTGTCTRKKGPSQNKFHLHHRVY